MLPHVKTKPRPAKIYRQRHTITTFSKGDHVSIAVPAHDRGPTDSKRIFGKIIEVGEDKPDYYEIATRHGILDRMFPVNQLLPLPPTISLEIPSRRMKKITLAHAARQESTSSTVPIACSCKKGCKSARCQCKKYKQKYSVEGVDCGNLSSLATRIEKGQVEHKERRSKRKRRN
jgi:hypothetical protein